MRPALVFILMAVAMMLFGCSGGENGSTNQTGNGSAINTTTPGGNGGSANATPPEECKVQFTYCYTGETIKSQDCINGKAVKWFCEPYYARHNKSIDGIPAPFTYLAEYACYWGVRDKFGYAGNYHPAYVCQGPIVAGWIESCQCANYIELAESANPKRYYIKR